jgi:hypothetical protein
LSDILADHQALAGCDAQVGSMAMDLSTPLYYTLSTISQTLAGALDLCAPSRSFAPLRDKEIPSPRLTTSA